ncbi:cell division protein ZipA C-terminal FtsZ-binding domain-containing protein [Vreelandella nanhaiensis]|uniref:Cell division protein ZipA n=1 Tax=Vreelandella nanhaiensis TaxID=1258546 RepID=A0A3S0Y8U9_9GAMM|nr:cell division protein ZipA C-terminal FtsZ-binding domain-containing protein [Halomonas nanhaiensis]RUR33151.1 hypothetical protein ELY38_06255 [Halomonas nanhaiensis]
MDRTTAILMLALISLVFGGLATAIFVYIIIPWRRRRAKNRAAKLAPLSASVVEPPIETPVTTPPAAKVSQHSLFIIFAEPGQATEQTLTQWLQKIKADYDPLKKVFLVAGQQPANPITIANAFLPGELPDLYRNESADEEIKGISLIVKPPLHKRRNQQMIAFVALAKEAATLFNADVLDTQHQNATEDTYTQIIG